MISSHLTQLNYYFPWNLVVSLLLAIIFSVIGVIVYRSATRKDENEPIIKPPSALLKKIHLFLARFGYSSTDPLSQSFTYALELMHDFIGGTQFRYQLPWIVMLGTSNAGKTTVLQSLALDRPIGRPDFETKSEQKPLCDWWFYNHGIVLDLDGKLVLGSSQINSEEDNWKLFLNLLTHHRPKRALDGVILTIPASEIIGRDRLSHDEIMLRAGYLYGKLWQMQHMTGIKVPIYIMVTKCDLVPGFQSFCKAIPSHNKHDMFGWSNSHPIDSSYDTEWIDEAFSILNGSLYQDQEEIYADGKNTVNSDDIFLFPLTLNTLKDGIRTYSDNLFKASGYHESFFLRGIYFVGDSSIETPALNETSKEVSLKVGSINKVKRNSLYFIENLFEYKAFREVGLARPLSQALLGNSTAIRFGKITIAVAAVLGTLGLLRANDSLQKAKMNLVPALSQIDITLEKIHGQNAQSDMGRVFFDEQAQVLLNTMTQISVNHLSSVFIPASWLSNIDFRIKYVMSLAYDQVILQSLSSQLDYKATQLFSENSTIPVTEVAGNGIYPLETIEFYRLQNYVISTQALELAAQKFNELGSSANLNDVADIIKYLFNYDMPQSFFTHSSYYTTTLKYTNIKPFDFKTYQREASSKLHTLFDQFQLACFDPIRMIPGLGQLSTTLNEITGAHHYTADVDALRNAYVSLNETITSIQDPGLQWINADVFNPGPQYDYILGLIKGSKFFMQTESTNFAREIDQNFLSFRKQLASYASPLIAGETIFSTENNLALNKPSDGTLSLQQYLTLFFNESFMAQANNQSIITAVPTGSALLWDVLRLQQAVSVTTDYTNFMNSRLLNMPKALQPLLHKVGSDSLTKNITQFLAEAEVFSSDTNGSIVSSPEDVLLTQVQNYRTASPYLEQILSTLKAINSTVVYSALKGLLNTEVYLPLQKLDAILGAEAPYSIKMDSFDWWDGKPMAALEAYSVFNVTELKSYLQQQRDRINYLAQEFSEPLVSLLEQINIENMPGNLPLVKKWQEILDELNGYTHKTPGNELTALEDFITTPLNEVVLATCRKYTDDSKLMATSQDFFTRIHISLMEKLHKRCADLSGSVSMDSYSQIAKFFNANLAGKFPFVQDPTEAAPDAAPEDIRTFFELLDSQGSDVKATLAEAKDLGTAGQNALAFIKQIEQVRSFFGDYLVPNSTLPFPAFAYDVTFRVNKSKEDRANEILHWELTTQDTKITMRSPSHTGYWSTGNPVMVIFRWAQNSPLQPQETEGVLGYNAQGEDASFSYSGTWAFLRLLLQHQAKASDFSSLNDEDPITLRFDIPLTNVVSNNPSTSSSSCSSSSSSTSSSSVDKLPAATVFVRLKVSPIKMRPPKKETPVTTTSSTAASSTTSSTPEKPKIQAGPPVDLPYFPYQAPRLTLETTP